MLHQSIYLYTHPSKINFQKKGGVGDTPKTGQFYNYHKKPTPMIKLTLLSQITRLLPCHLFHDIVKYHQSDTYSKEIEW